ncbi:MAG: hypothetical protein AAF693_17030 [Bacteroidota bacterium]
MTTKQIAEVAGVTVDEVMSIRSRMKKVRPKAVSFQSNGAGFICVRFPYVPTDTPTAKIKSRLMCSSNYSQSKKISTRPIGPGSYFLILKDEIIMTKTAGFFHKTEVDRIRDGQREHVRLASGGKSPGTGYLRPFGK